MGRPGYKGKLVKMEKRQKEAETSVINSEGWSELPLNQKVAKLLAAKVKPEIRKNGVEITAVAFSNRVNIFLKSAEEIDIYTAYRENN